MTEPTFTPIDLESWKRREIFHYFTAVTPTTYTITEELDITELKRALKANNLKFYPAYLFLVTRAISEIEEMRIGYRDKTLGIWSHLTPFYAVFHPDATLSPLCGQSIVIPFQSSTEDSWKTRKSMEITMGSFQRRIS